MELPQLAIFFRMYRNGAIGRMHGLGDQVDKGYCTAYVGIPGTMHD